MQTKDQALQQQDRKFFVFAHKFSEVIFDGNTGMD
jgi:hypothetical protein